jgi:hypothetical protein
VIGALPGAAERWHDGPKIGEDVMADLFAALSPGINAKRKNIGRSIGVGTGAPLGITQAKPSASMPEVSHPGEDHRDARRVGGGDHFGVAHRAAGRDDRGRAGLDRRQKAVGEGKERV